MLFFPPEIVNIILRNINIERKEMFCDNWKNLNTIAVVYKCRNESTEGLWDAASGRNIFSATLFLEKNSKRYRGFFDLMSKRYDHEDGKLTNLQP